MNTKICVQNIEKKTKIMVDFITSSNIIKKLFLKISRFKYRH